MICELINPSDPYTLVCRDFTIGAVAVAVLGRGQIGLRHGNRSTPILFGWDAWFAEQGIADLGAYLRANYEAVAEALDSVLIGDANDRADAESMLAMLSGEQQTKWLAERHDRRRSSMNDLWNASMAMAARLRQRYSEPPDGRGMEVA